MKSGRIVAGILLAVAVLTLLGLACQTVAVSTAQTVTQVSAQESSPLGVVEGIIIGVLVLAFGTILQFMLARKEDKRHSRELRQEQQQRREQKQRQKREKAYVKIYAILERLDVKTSTTRIVTNDTNFRDLQAAVEDNYEVLDRSTIEAWRQKKLTHGMASGYVEYTIEEAGLFFGNVRTHYERFDKGNAYYSRRDEDVESTGT